jgi:hypothetical protein
MSNKGKLTKQLLRDALRGKGSCPEVKAGERLQYLWKDPSDIKSSDPLHDTLSLMRHSSNDLILNFICSEFEGVFLKNIDAKESHKTIFQDQANIICEVADVVKVLTDSCADGKMTMEEIESFEKEIDDLNRAAFGFIQAAKKGRRE